MTPYIDPIPDGTGSTWNTAIQQMSHLLGKFDETERWKNDTLF
jgi:hypothetical protein